MPAPALIWMRDTHGPLVWMRTVTGRAVRIEAAARPATLFTATHRVR